MPCGLLTTVALRALVVSLCRKSEKTNDSLLKLVEETEAKIDIHPLLNKVRHNLARREVQLSLPPVIPSGLRMSICLSSHAFPTPALAIATARLCLIPSPPSHRNVCVPERGVR